MSIDEIPRQLGRYVLYDRIATGGMATVHFGRMRGAIGFSRLVAIKRLRPNFANDVHFVQMFLDEARLAARLEHPNVVSTLDVVADEGEVFLVMEHVLGDSLEALMREVTGRMSIPIPIPIISAIVCGVLEGLHFAHEAQGDDGTPLEIVHRDVSPHNILVGLDGVARVFDFGIAKASTNTQETREGVVKGKVAYMAPEQVRGAADRRADIYAVGVILWELLAGRRRHAGERNDALFLKLARNELDPPRPPSTIRRDCPFTIDAIVARATHPLPEHRFGTAREMAVALEAAVAPAPARDVTEWVRTVAGTRIERVAEVMRRIEADVRVSDSKLNAAPVGSASSSSVHVVTASIRPTDSVSARALSAEHSRSSERPAVVRSRSWTMPAALIAFTAALLLVGLRTLANRNPQEPRVVQDAVTQAATSVPAVTGTPAFVQEAPPTGAVASTPAAAQSASAAPPADAAPSASTAPSTTAEPTRVTSRPPPSPPRVVYTPPARPKEREAPPPPPPARSEPAAAPATTSAGSKPGCESPFVINSDGIRQIKPECM